MIKSIFAFASSSSFTVDSVYIDNNKDNFTSSILNLGDFFFFFLLHCIFCDFQSMLYISGESEHPCLIPDLRGKENPTKPFSLSLLNLILALVACGCSLSSWGSSCPSVGCWKFLPEMNVVFKLFFFISIKMIFFS